MSSSKKKRVTTVCVGCNCIVLSKDLEKHLVTCGSDSFLNDMQIIRPKEFLIGIEQSVEHWETYIAPEIFGWIKYNSVLMHPETMLQLGLVPRQPCVYQKNDMRRAVLVWPCEAVLQLRISVGKKTNTGFFRLSPIHKFIKENILRLKPLKRHNFYTTTHFREYVTTFLSGAYILVGGIVQIPFYGILCDFAVEQALDSQMNNLNITDDQVVAIKLELKSDVSIEVSELITGENKLAFSSFGGGKKAKDDLLNYLVTPIKEGSAGLSVILNGISGSGKTLMLKILESELQSKAVFFRNDDNFEEQAVLLQGKGPCVVLIDNFDRCSTSNSDSLNMAEKLSRFMDKNKKISVVLAVQNIDKFELFLRRRFALEIELNVPSLFERIEILTNLLQNYGDVAPEMIRHIAGQTHGFTGSDLSCLCKLAGVDKKKNALCDLGQRLRDARKRVTPTGIREVVLEVPNVQWEDIGGYTALKDEIKQAVLWPQQYPEVFARFNIPAPSGILLYGPPGCSKTLIARALASQSKLNFLAVKGPELFSKWVGESERAVRELFRRARQVAPSILFFDEIDAVAVSRGEKGGSGVGDRVLAQLLTELDGLEKKSGVVVLAATNRPDTLDGALLRPGRLDKAIYVSLPDREARKSILRLYMDKIKLHEHVDLDTIVVKTEGYSGAEVVAVYREAVLIALRETPNADLLRMEHFLESLKTVVPRTSKRSLEIYESFKIGS